MVNRGALRAIASNRVTERSQEKSVDVRRGEGTWMARAHDSSLSFRAQERAQKAGIRSAEINILEFWALSMNLVKQIQESIGSGILAVRYHMQRRQNSETNIPYAPTLMLNHA
jgi:hypothetical protein